MVVDANIEKMGTTRDLIFGYVKPESYVEVNSGNSEVVKGYFIIDKKTGIVTTGLDMRQWEEALRDLDVINPHLDPTR